jgi:hypothetical protein
MAHQNGKKKHHPPRQHKGHGGRQKDGAPRVLTRLAQAQVQPFEQGSRFKLTVDKKNLTRKIKEITVNYSGDGQSGMTFTLDSNLEGSMDAPVSLQAGYGNHMTKYFDGALEEPDDDPFTFYSTAVAYGPFKILGTEYFDTFVDYSGKTIGEVLADIINRAGFPLGSIDIAKPGSFTFDTLSFTEENSLLEAAQRATSDANYVFVDRPGFRREIMPTPKPLVGIPPKAVYTEKHYARGKFTLKPQPVNYAKVVVFHRAASVVQTSQPNPGSSSGGGSPGTSGSTTATPEAPFDDIHAEAPVKNHSKYKPPPNRIYWVPDFVGTQQDAEVMAHLMAERLSLGLFDFELTCAFNPALLIYDTIEIQRLKQDGPHVVRQKYQCTIDKSITVNIKEKVFDMTLSGTAVQISKHELSHPHKKKKHHKNKGNVNKPTSATRTFTDWGQTDMWLDLAPDYSLLN